MQIYFLELFLKCVDLFLNLTHFENCFQVRNFSKYVVTVGLNSPINSLGNFFFILELKKLRVEDIYMCIR